MLSGNYSELSAVRSSYIPCPIVTIVKGCHTVMQRVRQHQEVGHWTNKIVNGLKSVLQSFITDVQLGSKCTSIPCMIYLSKMCISICRWTKYMVAGLAHKIFKKETNNNKKNV